MLNQSGGSTDRFRAAQGGAPLACAGGRGSWLWRGVAEAGSERILFANRYAKQVWQRLAQSDGLAGGYRGFARDGRPYSPEEWPIWRVLARHGESRAQQAPRPPANRYEYAQPGELVHLDAKKLGRFWQVGKHVLGGKRRNPNAGWQHAHVAVDDHSRWAMVELRPAEDAESCTSFLSSVISAYSEQGITIRRVMTDNGAGYRSRRFRALVAKHGIRHIRTKPYTPRTNGKAEAFIRILQREWAYAFIYPSSAHRARALHGWVRWYNQHRPHGSLDGHPPINRISHAARSYT